MKKLLCTLLALTTAASFAGCKKDSGKQPEQKDTVAVYLPSEKVSYTDSGEILSKITYEYDQKGRLLKETLDSPVSETYWVEEEGYYAAELFPCDGQPDSVMEYTYDDRGNLTSYVYRRCSDDVWEDYQRSAYSYTYDENGQITGYRYLYEQPDAQYLSHREYTVEYENGKAARVLCKDVDSQQEPLTVAEFTYNEKNLLTVCKLTDPESVSPIQHSFTYNAQDRLTAVIGRSGNEEPQFDLRFSYDGSGRLISEECAAPLYQKYLISYTYEGDTLTRVERNSEALFNLDENGCAIRPVGEDYQYHYIKLELSREDAALVQYDWNRNHSYPSARLMEVAGERSRWSPYFIAVKQPIHEIGPMLPYYL